ncbi:MAG: methyltransferase [Acidobacteria bacterium]|nr:MAG: methyltransferase [Acidobacteriota bacterium]
MMTKPRAKDPPTPAVMFSLITGRFVSHLIDVAARLELADLLKDGPRTVEDLAMAAEVQAPALYRVLRALASVGIFAETKGKRFKLTPLAATLQKGASMRGVALFCGLPSLSDAWAQLLHGVQTGETPFLKVHGMSHFEYLEKHPEEASIFNETMTNVSSTEIPAIAATYKFSRIRTLVDLGGGHGSLLATILQANPKLKGVLFDQPSVIASAKQDRHVTKGIAERCTLEAGSFFEAVTKGADAYMMKSVLHDWDEEQCTKILANCRAAMSENGKILVIESIIVPGNKPDRGKLRDIQMLVTTGGRERTKEEFATLFRRSGFKLTRVVPTKCPLSIVEGIRA